MRMLPLSHKRVATLDDSGDALHNLQWNDSSMRSGGQLRLISSGMSCLTESGTLISGSFDCREMFLLASDSK